MLGKWKEGRTILDSADSLFIANFNIANRNITIPGEKDRLTEIESGYSKYKNLWERPIVDTDKEGNLNWYFREVHTSFLTVKSAVDDLINLNNQIMYSTASDMENSSNRAIMPGIIAVISALIFTLVFNYLVNYYFVSPIIRITDRIKKFEERRIPFDVKIETSDEIFHLANAIDHLCQSVSFRDDKS
jgi:HAMP domain-containing protein